VAAYLLANPRFLIRQSQVKSRRQQALHSKANSNLPALPIQSSQQLPREQQLTQASRSSQTNKQTTKQSKELFGRL